LSLLYLVLVDSESALSTQNVVDLLENWGVKVAVFPPGLGKLMNPCDAYFHSLVKRYYYRLVHQNIETAKERKYVFIREAYYSVSENSIVSFFTHCGILGDKNPEEVMNNLLSEGLCPNKKFRELHTQQIEAYEAWCFINGKDPKII
jgi:hypothetical protein